MSDARLGILLSADTKQAEQGLNNFNKAVDATNVKLKQSEAAGAAFGKGVTQAQTALSKLPNTANQSTLALTNLGRVVQDAPFGFLGIANNLNPLLESFQRLKASTGSTGGALKALGKDLMGAGGIGFALSLASTAAILFGDKLFQASKAAKEAKNSASELKDTIDGVFKSAGREAAEVGSLIAVLKSETETRERKNLAIKELQRIQPDVFNGLKLEGAAVAGLDAAYKNYLDNLKTVIAVKIRQAQLEQLITKQLELEGATQTQTIKNILGGLKAFEDKQLEKAKGKGDATGAFIVNSILGSREDNKKQLDQIKSDIDAAFKDIQELSKGVVLDPEKVKKAGDKSSEIIAMAKRINEAYKDIITLRLNIQPDDTTIQQLQKAKTYLDNYFKRNFKFVLPPFEVDITPPPLPTVPTGGLEFGQMFAQELKAYFSKDFVTDFSLLQALIDSLKPKVKTAAEVLADEFNESINQAFQGSFSAIGESLGNLLSGEEFGSSMLNVFSGLLSSIGQALIKYGAIKQGLDKILGPSGFAIPGAVAVGLGVAAIAASQILRNFGGFRAGGGPVSAGMAYVVGEKRPEIFVPNTNGRIIPDTRMTQMGSGFSGMGSVQVIPLFRNGQLDLMIKRGNKYLSANV